MLYIVIKNYQQKGHDEKSLGTTGLEDRTRGRVRYI